MLTYLGIPAHHGTEAFKLVLSWTSPLNNSKEHQQILGACCVPTIVLSACIVTDLILTASPKRECCDDLISQAGN